MRLHLFQTGVAAKPMIQTNGKIMMGTSMVYLIIQIPAFVELAKNPGQPHKQATVETKWVLVSMVACFATFVGYLVYCVRENNKHDEEKDGLSPIGMKTNNVVQKVLDQGLMSIGTVLAQEMKAELLGDREGSVTSLMGNAPDRKRSVTSLMGTAPETSARLTSFLKKKFNEYDEDRSGTLEVGELRILFGDLGVTDKAHFKGMLEEMDTDHDGHISFDEFKKALMLVVVEPLRRIMQGTADGPDALALRAQSVNNPYEDGGDDVPLLTGDADEPGDDDDEEEEMPTDISQLPANEQMAAVVKRSLKMMAVGTIVVLLVSDPTVDLLSDLGDRLHIPAFVISFLLAPMASNASELVAAYSYAKKKTAATMQVSLSTLEGAGIMNNTFTTAIFFIGMYINKPSATSEGIEWGFTCETIGIVVVQLIVGTLAQKKVFRLIDGFVILSLFPLSLIGIMLLKTCTHLDGFDGK